MFRQETLDPVIHLRKKTHLAVSNNVSEVWN